ncbi:hypothetical protein [Mangrovibacterium lignilyticum]|uniref:hypothetical protein n=1 Tax=Mangrovibacterium lignilyticum TaxID=2668052 RepID=UPI0013D0A278|nr:hypothetical protein [Mangrovibacterium lignilyticum]
MEENNNLKKIQEAIESLPDNFSILEEQIDVELQMQYFEFTKDKTNNQGIEDFEAAEAQLYDPEISETDKKKLLVRLAGHDKVESFRIIERFRTQAEGPMRNWAILAIQEARMILQSSLLDEQQVYISTGLGGKGQNIRYFITLLNQDIEEDFTPTQKKLIETEFQYFLNKSEGELEEMNFDKGFALGLFLFPLKKNLQDIFKSFIEECNQYGNFLREDVIITNVKQLSIDEIRTFLNQEENIDEEENDT